MEIKELKHHKLTIKTETQQEPIRFLQLELTRGPKIKH
jgi:hypothetical protein